MAELNIKISDSSSNAIITYKSNNSKIENTKSVLIEELISGLLADHSISTGILPNGTKMFSGTSNNYRILIETPPKVRKMKILKLNSDGTKKIKEVIEVPYPICLFDFSIKDCGIYDVRIYSLKNTLQKMDDNIYCFPFSNVYTDGRVCWGGVKLPIINNPIELIGVINTFIESEFKGDLAGTNFLNKVEDTEILDFWMLIKFLTNKNSFPVEVLKKNGYKLNRLGER